MKTHGTFFGAADNSGAKKLFCIGQPKPKLKIGDMITVSVKEALPSHRSRVKKGKVYKAVIVELKKKTKRYTHLKYSFGRNLVVLVNQKGDPIGTRVNSLGSYELRSSGRSKIASISPYLF
uniref:Ribosomal protein L14 n=1 Tax=Chloropicon primus TaxID=1764295 RepID=A0A4D6C441_9CHLO|nr:ribosomal protein L14 [Chloropicon primus]QBX98462.1 ribosomal protein L14 [Chloropicon primus]